VEVKASKGRYANLYTKAAAIERVKFYAGINKTIDWNTKHYAVKGSKIMNQGSHRVGMHFKRKNLFNCKQKKTESLKFCSSRMAVGNLHRRR